MENEMFEHFSLDALCVRQNSKHMFGLDYFTRAEQVTSHNNVQ